MVFSFKKSWSDYAVKAARDTYTFYETAAISNLLGMWKIDMNKEVVWIQPIQKRETSESVSEFACDREY